MSKKIIVRGPALSQSGYGEQCRFALRALRKYPERFDIYLMNTPWGNTGWIWEDNEERQWIDSILQKTFKAQQLAEKYDISLQVCIPSEWQPLAPLNIGYTAGIETDKISTKWFEGCFKINKIIVTSNHAKQGIENTSYQATNNQTGQQFVAHVETPIEVVSYPVRHYEPKEIDLELKHDFNFLTVCQWGPRKNLETVVKCFLEEFSNKNVGLIIKTQTIANCLMDRLHTEQRLKALVNQLSKEKERKCSIQLLHGDLTPEEMTYLYRHPKIKALVSLTHGEGFGLPLFEAVYNGLPVIAPVWSGQTDFAFMPSKDTKSGKMKEKCMIGAVSYDIKNIQPEAVYPDMLIPESKWCFPKEFHARQVMRDMFKNYGPFLSNAKKLQAHILQKMDSDKMHKMFADAVLEDIPTVNIADFLSDPPEKNKLLEEVVEFAQ